MPSSAIAAISAWAGSLTVASVLTFVAKTLVFSAVSSLLQKKPSSGDLRGAGRTVTQRQSAAARRIIYGEGRYGGPVVFMHAYDTAGTDHWLHIIIVLAGHEVEEIGDIYFDDYKLQLNAAGVEIGRYATDDGNFVRVGKHRGEPNQQPDYLAAANTGGKWTTSHRLYGCAYLYVQLIAEPELFPNGVPNITAVIKGKNDIYDPRTDTTGYSNNAALCLANYLADTRYGRGAAYGTEIHTGALITAANICDELVATKSGSTERRYCCDGGFETTSTPKEIIQSMLTAMTGRSAYVGGRWHLYAGAYYTPTAPALTVGHLRGPITMQALQSRRDTANGVKGLYISPANNWQPSDFPAVSNASYLAEDGGRRQWLDIELPFTISTSAAQRIAKIELERARQQITVVLRCKLSAWRVKPGDVVPVTIERFGWLEKPFEVVGSTLAVESDGTVGIDHTLRETAAGVFDWNSGEETQGDVAPNTTLPDPWTVAAPTGLAVVESIYVTREGDGVKARASLRWIASATAFVIGYRIQYRAVDTEEWRSLAPTENTSSDIDDIAPGEFDFRVKAVTTLGVSSPWATVRASISGLYGKPLAAQDITISTIGGLAIIRWRQSTDLDVRIGGWAEFRHSPEVSATWVQSTSIGEALPGMATVAVLPLKAGAYLLRFRDSSGVYSDEVSVKTEQATALGYATVTSLVEHPTFSGTKDQVTVSGGALQLDSTNIDTVPDIDVIENIDFLGSVYSSGTYSFSGGIDQLTVQAARLTSYLSALIVNSNDLIDDRVLPVDEWQDFDGTAAAGADAVVDVRHTNDDPSGTPVWSSWQRLDSAEFQARAFEFRCRLLADDPSYNIEISELAVTLDQVT
jgi:hypothetical protein